MILKDIVKKIEGKFITLYYLHYKNRLGNEKVYEIISRDNNITMENSGVLTNKAPQAIILVVFNKEKTHILLNKEFRMAVNSVVYNLPAGLIESNESYLEAGRRELKEETGLDLVDVIKVLPPTFSAVGISNEKTVCIICTAEGEIGGNPEPDEEIEPIWLSKEELSKMFDGTNSDILMTARTQAFSYSWVNGLI